MDILDKLAKSKFRSRFKLRAKELEYIKQCIEAQKICGDGAFTKKCNAWFEEKTGTSKCLLTTSCTHATELAAILCDIKPGDEVITVACGFPTTIAPIMQYGAVPVFVAVTIPECCAPT